METKKHSFGTYADPAEFLAAAAMAALEHALEAEKIEPWLFEDRGDDTWDPGEAAKKRFLDQWADWMMGLARAGGRELLLRLAKKLRWTLGEDGAPPDATALRIALVGLPLSAGNEPPVTGLAGLPPEVASKASEGKRE